MKLRIKFKKQERVFGEFNNKEISIGGQSGYYLRNYKNQAYDICHTKDADIPTTTWTDKFIDELIEEGAIKILK